MTQTIKNYVEQTEGNGFNDKFEKLVLKCREAEPELDKRLRQKKDELIRINQEIIKSNEVLSKLDFLKQNVEKCCQLFSDKQTFKGSPQLQLIEIQRQSRASFSEKTSELQLNSVYTRSGQNSTPNSNATNLHSSQKRCCSFCISSSNASPTFQVQKSIFHQMTKPIQVTVILPLLLAISFSRNDDIHSSISGISNDLIGVIPTIGQ